MTDRKTKKRRLTDAGFVHVSAWLPAAYAARVQAQADTYRDEVLRVLDAPAAPRGRPRKFAGQEDIKAYVDRLTKQSRR
jgi:hypothetical protein